MLSVTNAQASNPGSIRHTRSTVDLNHQNSATNPVYPTRSAGTAMPLEQQQQEQQPPPPTSTGPCSKAWVVPETLKRKVSAANALRNRKKQCTLVAEEDDDESTKSISGKEVKEE